MKKTLLAIGAEEVSDGYYYSENIGSFLCKNSIIMYDPISSFEPAAETVMALREIIEESRKQQETCTIVIDKSSVEEDEKDIFPSFLANFNDFSKEQAFLKFFEDNRSFIESEMYRSFEQTDLTFFYDGSAEKFSLGALKIVEKSGDCTLHILYQEEMPFSLEKFKEPAPFIQSFFPEHVEVPDSAIAEDYFEANPSQRQFFATTLEIRESSIRQRIEFLNRQSAMEATDCDIYDEDYDDTKSFYEVLYADLDNGKFVFNPEKMEEVLAKINSEKFKSLF